MEIHKFAKKTLWSLLLVGMMLCCVSEDDYPSEEKKPVEPLTVESARSLYEQYVGRTASLKSAGEDSGIELLPDWSAGQLSSDSLWYVVESPLEFIGDRQMRLVTPSVEEYVGPEAKASDIKQYQRLVMAQNKESGDTYAFVMMIIPELDYMLQKGDQLDANKYFSREHDLDGRIMFFTTDGRFVNGWIYEQGKLTAFIGSGNNANSIFRTKAYSYYWDCIDKKEYNELGILISEKECFKVYVLGEVEINGTLNDSDNPDDLTVGWPGGGGIIGGFTPIYPGGGGSGNSNSDKDKEPEKRTDCDEKATQNANNAQTALNDANIKVKADQLRANAKNSLVEYVMGISYDAGFKSYNVMGGELIKGNAGDNSVGIAPSAYTIFTMHSHHQGLNAAPSPGDLIATVEFYRDIKALAGNSYRGTINVAANGAEYMIYVSDPAALERFYNGLQGNDFYQRDGVNFMEGSEWREEYNKAFETLKKGGYSENDAQSYALSHVADKYNMGLKISSRKNKDSTFKEQKTATEGSGKNTKYKPQQCP